MNSFLMQIKFMLGDFQRRKKIAGFLVKEWVMMVLAVEYDCDFIMAHIHPCSHVIRNN